MQCSSTIDHSNSTLLLSCHTGTYVQPQSHFLATCDRVALAHNEVQPHTSQHLCVSMINHRMTHNASNAQSSRRPACDPSRRPVPSAVHRNTPHVPERVVSVRPFSFVLVEVPVLAKSREKYDFLLHFDCLLKVFVVCIYSEAESHFQLVSFCFAVAPSV